MYQRVDRPLIPVVSAMERKGIRVDRSRLAGLSEEFARESARLEGEIHALAGQEFAIASPRQLGEILFDKLGRSEEHTSELQSLMRISYAVFCLKKKIKYKEIKNMS